MEPSHSLDIALGDGKLTSVPENFTATADLEKVYPQWIELAALSMTFEYCERHSITDRLLVRYVHYHALCVVLTEEGY